MHMKPRFFCIFDSMCSEPSVATPGMRLHMGGGGGGQWSDSYSWGIIFHVNRGWQDIAILLCVKLAVAHIYTRSALQIALKKQKRGYIKTLFFVARTHTHTQEISQSASFYKSFCDVGVLEITKTKKRKKNCQDETCCTSSCLNGQCTSTALLSNSANRWFNLSFISADVAMLRAEPPSPQSRISLLTVILVLWLLDWEENDD